MKKNVTLLAIMILLFTNLLSCRLLKSDDSNSDRENADVNENAGNNEESNNDSESLCVHSWVKDEAKEPSCTESGLSEGIHCALCDETPIKQETLDAKGHTLTTFSAKAVSCARSGWNEYESCEICDYSTYEEISALEHEYQGGFCIKCDEPIPSEGLTYTLSEDGTYYTVSGIGSCTDTKLVIPGIYNGLPVTKIGELAFYQCKHITELTICNGISYVEYAAFEGCSQLKKVTFPASMESFDGFYGLKIDSVYIKDMTVWCNAKHPSYFFSEETKLYLNNEHVTELTIPEGITKINDYAFYNYTGLTSVTIPNGVTEIGAYAFSTCTNLTSISIPDSMIIIGNAAFSNCANLKSISIPDNVTKIGNSAFLTCKKLETVKFGKGIETIGGHAFLNSDGIKNIYISDLAKWCSITYNSVHAQVGNSSSSLNLYINEELVTDLIIPEGVTSIGDFAFRGIDSIKSVTIPEGVKSIGKFAFYDCDNLIDIKIADSVEIIDSKAFNSCNNLKEITLGSGMKSIEYYAFNYCPSLCNIYYTGTLNEWRNISICMVDSGLASTEYYFYSEAEPETEGNFWHYVDGVPTIWE